MTLEQLGWNPAWETSFAGFHNRGWQPGRVAIEDKHHYVAQTAAGPLTAIATGKLLHQTDSPADLPKVGDWVALTLLPAEEKAVIHAVLPRKTKISRKITGRETEEQVLVTNIDTAFVVQAVDGTFNPARLERMLVMVHEGGARPVVVLNKTDLCENVAGKHEEARKAAADAPVLSVSALTGEGVDQLAQLIHPGETIVFIGTSGVGKSTLINRLYGEEIQATAEVRAADFKGRHTTSWREMIVLPQGGIVIDTPGMREFHMWLAGQGLQEAFAEIDKLAVNCHFRDCTHTVEKQCAVTDALARGELPDDRYQSYLKLQRELAYLEEAQTKRTWLDRKRRAKAAQRAFNKFKRPPD